MLVQIVFGIDGGMMSAVVLLFDASIPAAMAAATTADTVTVVVVVVDASIPNGPTGATAAVPPALTPAAHDDTAF